MQVQVTSVETQSRGVKSFELLAQDGGLLPPFEPGAHIRVTIPDLDGLDPTRAYSLISDPSDLTHYQIAVLHVESGNGGSATLHRRLKVGDQLEVSAPHNEFRLEESAKHSILIAGGIGVTPILSLARELARHGASFEVHYVGRSEDRMPYRNLVARFAGERANFYVSRAGFNVEEVLVGRALGSDVYVCGPHSLIEAVRETARAAGFPPHRIHFESFGYRRLPADRAVELELRGSGITILADPGRPLLEAMESAGVWIPADCRRGECATCVTSIIEGAGHHRDHCLTPEQRSSSICACVSWAAGNRLVLDI